MRSLFWSFLIPPFLWIELTPYMCRVLFGSWLALRMPNASTMSFFKTFRCRKSNIQNRKRARTIYIYVYNFKTHTHIYIFFDENYASECIVHEFLFIYVSLDSGIVHIQISVQGLPKARSKGQAEF